MTTTRKLLERVPDGKFDWKPHPEVDVARPPCPARGDDPDVGQRHDAAVGDRSGRRCRRPRRPAGPSCSPLFDTNVADTRSALTGRTDGEFMAPWTLKNSGQTIFTMPKAAVWRGFVMNHLIHHRAQLSVYLRMNDVPIPSMYGPSADETAF